MSLVNEIKRLLSDIWDGVKKQYVRLVNFVRNILSWFRQPARMKKVQEDKNKVANAIKTTLESGQFVVLNVFDRETNEIEEAEAIRYEELDDDLKDKFADKEMIVLR